MERVHMTQKLRLLSSAAVLGIFWLGMTTLYLVGTGSASAAVISFSEDPAGTTPIVVNTDIVGATIAISVESASLSVGNVTGPSTLLLKRAMTNQRTMTMEGGGGGVSDVLELDSFVSNGATVGFLAMLLSDPETSPERGIPTPQGLTLPNILEDGTLQLLTPAGFSVTLPGIGLVNLAVSAQSDAVEGPEGVPEPSTLALLSAGLFGLGIIRRRRPSDVMARPET
jgi:PEP-CTERM motif